MTPTRIQRRRVKGFMQPEGTIYCGRPTRWANPFIPFKAMKLDVELIPMIQTKCDKAVITPGSADECVLWYEIFFRRHIASNGTKFIEPLRKAKHLSCWCQLDRPCHVDVLIKLLLETDK